MSRKIHLCLVVTASASIAAGVAGAAQSGNLTGADPLAPGTAVGRAMEAPVNTRPVAQKWWWRDRWFDDGILEEPVNHEVSERDVSYVNPADDTEVPAILYRPRTSGPFPGVLFQHGRRGLDPLVQRLARRMAARGFVVLAPNVFDARFIDRFPLTHDYKTEGDVNAGVDYLLGQPDVSTSKICLYSHTRGGYYTLKVAVTFKRQKKDVACYVSFYPHLQDPNLPEPEQVYRYAPEVDKLEIPVRIFMGEYEQYQRRRSIELAVGEMKKAGRDVRLVIYPGVGRGFDFRTPRVRTFADDLATRDSVMRAAAFMRRQLAPWARAKPAANRDKK
ncbi:dienelactone hydrolase family protein [bacterium BMS3Bbin10]|nr:dienelactone hydrolase family protein [bacterium BMS3Bbin10]